MEVEPEDRPKTAFTICDSEFWQFKVMPFGLCNSGATFVKLMEKVLKWFELENLHGIFGLCNCYWKIF